MREFREFEARPYQGMCGVNDDVWSVLLCSARLSLFLSDVFRLLGAPPRLSFT